MRLHCMYDPLPVSIRRIALLTCHQRFVCQELPSSTFLFRSSMTYRDIYTLYFSGQSQPKTIKQLTLFIAGMIINIT